MILYGTNPIAWANDDDQSIGADIATERILDEAGRQIGFDGIENGHRWPEDPVELKRTLGGYGLKWISGWYSIERSPPNQGESTGSKVRRRTWRPSRCGGSSQRRRATGTRSA